MHDSGLAFKVNMNIFVVYRKATSLQRSRRLRCCLLTSMMLWTYLVPINLAALCHMIDHHSLASDASDLAANESLNELDGCLGLVQPLALLHQPILLAYMGQHRVQIGLKRSLLSFVMES